MNKQLAKAQKNLVACHSFRGHDFEAVGARWGQRAGRTFAGRVAWEKRETVRAGRRLGKAIVRDARNAA
jgi:hypothetical protein